MENTMTVNIRTFFIYLSLVVVFVAGCSGSKNSNSGGKYGVVGTVSGVISQGVTITLSGAATAVTTTDVSGNYAFNNLANGSYSVVPSYTGYTFTPVSQAITINGKNVAGINFTATPITASTYSISGQVTFSGSPLSGVTLTLSGESSGSINTDASGNYSFNNILNGGYTITPTMLCYTFSPTSINVTVFEANVEGINFTATLQPPIGLTAIPGTQSVKLTWTPSAATGYYIYITYTTGLQPTVNTTTAPPYVVTGLTIGIPYYFTVTAYNNAGGSVPSQLVTAMPIPPLTYSVGSWPDSIAIDNSGDIWITNSGGNTVTEITYTNGNYITSGSRTIGNNPYGIAIDSFGNIWVANSSGGHGDTVSELLIGNGITETYQVGYVGDTPVGVAIDKAGNVWVTNVYGNSITGITYQSGEYVTTKTYPVGSNANEPWGIAIDGSGNVWVATGAFGSGNTITEVTTSGTVLTYVVGNGPVNIAIDKSGNIWVTNNSDGTVTELSSAGTIITTVTVGSKPEGIAIDDSGNIWVANKGGNTVSEVTTLLNSLTYNVGNGPVGIAIDASGNVWVTNWGSNNVTELNSSGTTVGTYGVGTNPAGIAIDASGNVWVANNGDNTVSKIMSVATGPQYFPYKGPQFPGSNI